MAAEKNSDGISEHIPSLQRTTSTICARLSTGPARLQGATLPSSGTARRQGSPKRDGMTEPNRAKQKGPAVAARSALQKS